MKCLVGKMTDRFLPHMAEEVGFEPTVPFPTHRLSRSAHSTTLALLRHTQGLQFTIQSLRFLCKLGTISRARPLCEPSNNFGIIAGKIRKNKDH